MALTLPPKPLATKRNSARLDVLRILLNDEPLEDIGGSSTGSNSPRDSLSPLEGPGEHKIKRKSKYGVDLTRREDSSEEDPSPMHNEMHVSFREPNQFERATASPAHVNTCSPRCLISRERRPRDLIVKRSNGLTTINVPELKQRIRDGCTGGYDATVQVPRFRSKRRSPKTPIRDVRKMGNTHSNTSSPTHDNVSIRNSTKNPVRALRKSSTNLLHRIESKSPLPPTFTSTVIEVRKQVSPPVTSNAKDENDESPIDPFMDRHCSSRSSAVMPSASSVTIAADSARRPLSASTTIRGSRSDTRTDSCRGSRTEEQMGVIEKPQTVPPARPASQATSHPLRISPVPAQVKRDSALSPTIPAPSPLPEDSPHKYGLKDCMETPEVPEPEEIKIAKPRRRSSGLEIFNEAKSLQSASSFLNGLSTSRRRAESTQRSTEASAWTLASYDTRRPASSARLSRPPSRPSSTLPPSTHSSDRRRGHSFKPSGFAFARPLNHVQLRCYKRHARLLPSRNKVAQVECSVCHIDDDRDHYSCSWCAMRMCRYCRTDFAERGLTALRERIKHAEFGGSGDSAESSTESVGLSRMKSSIF